MPDPVSTENNAKPLVFLAEDNRGDVLLVREALREYQLDVDLVVRSDGEQMLQLIEAVERGEFRCPDVVLLDLNLPRRSGLELLARIREISSCRNIAVVVVTSSNAPTDRDAVTRLGGTRYFCKPFTYDQFMHLGGIIKEILGHNERLQ